MNLRLVHSIPASIAPKEVCGFVPRRTAQVREIVEVDRCQAVVNHNSIEGGAFNG